jgi:hypothetical protein
MSDTETAAEMRNKHFGNQRRLAIATRVWFSQPGVDAYWNAVEEAYLQVEMDRAEAPKAPKPEPEPQEPELELGSDAEPEDGGEE